MNQNKTKKFKFFNATGTVNVCPIDRPSFETEFAQPIDVLLECKITKPK